MTTLNASSTNGGARSATNRRDFLRLVTLGAAGLATAGTAMQAVTPQAAAQGRILGTVLDYAGGVPSATAIRAGGHLGTIRYVSERRPGTERWMLGKPVTLGETTAQAALGLEVASIYQFGRAETADWIPGAAGAERHAPEAIRIHRAAGGPTGRPIYVAIDDNPTRAQYINQIRPYLRRFQEILNQHGYSLGVYGNFNTIEWALQDGLGVYFWQHDWGSAGRLHTRVHLHQKAGYKTRIDGVEVDINNVYQWDWGQWKPGQAGLPPIGALPMNSLGAFGSLGPR